MTDYASLKVPELKKLLAERSLPQSGNKADLIQRLQDNDKSQAEDVIDWDDDDTKTAAAATNTKQDDPKPAPAPAPAQDPPAATETPVTTEPAKDAAPAATDVKNDSNATEATETPAAEATTTAEQPAEPTSFAIGLSATEVEAELKKREDRAKRFGITTDKDSDDAKLAERAKRFGVDANTVVKGLDEALPERRPKRGREQGDDGHRGAKRQSHGRDGRHHHNNNNNNGSNKFRGNRRGGDGGRGGSGGRAKQGGGNHGVLADPGERAKAELRKKRFGGDK